VSHSSGHISRSMSSGIIKASWPCAWLPPACKSKTQPQSPPPNPLFLARVAPAHTEHAPAGWRRTRHTTREAAQRPDTWGVAASPLSAAASRRQLFDGDAAHAVTAPGLSRLTVGIMLPGNAKVPGGLSRLGRVRHAVGRLRTSVSSSFLNVGSALRQGESLSAARPQRGLL
jgi:hypothetical protein